jgi:hypothetical protein
MDLKAAHRFFWMRSRKFKRREDREDFVQEAMLDYLEQCIKKGGEKDVSYSFCAAHAFDKFTAKQLRRNRKMRYFVENEMMTDFDRDTVVDRIEPAGYHRLELDGVTFLLDDYDVISVSRFTTPRLVCEGKSRNAPIKLWVYRKKLYKSIADIQRKTGRPYCAVRHETKLFFLRWVK